MIETLQGDNLLKLQSLPSKLYSVALIDPPYCNSPVTGSYWEKDKQWRDEQWSSISEWIKWFRPRIELITEKLSTNCTVIIFERTRNLLSLRSLLSKLKLKFSCELSIYWKVQGNRFTRNHKTITPIHETAWILKRGRPYFKKGTGTKSVIEAVGSYRRKHPGQKPRHAIKQLLNCYTDKNSWVLDPFGGSGVTAVATQSLQANCTIIEKYSDRYQQMISNLSQSKDRDLKSLILELSERHSNKTVCNLLGVSKAYVSQVNSIHKLKPLQKIRTQLEETDPNHLPISKYRRKNFA